MGGKMSWALGAVMIIMILGGTFVGMHYYFTGRLPWEPETVIYGKMVTIKFGSQEIPGYAACDSIVNVFDKDMGFLEAVTPSSGIGTMTQMQAVGSTLKLQPRAAAPSSGDPYLGQVFTFKVPNADAGDEVYIGTVYHRDASENAPTMVVTDAAGNVASDQATYYFNTTDTGAWVHLSAIDDNTWWGIGDLIDHQTGKRWIGGIIVWKGATAQSFDNVDWVTSDPTYNYYIFGPFEFCDDTSVETDDLLSIFLSAGGGLVADGTVTIDGYDIQEFDDIVFASFGDAEQDISVETTKVA